MVEAVRLRALIYWFQVILTPQKLDRVSLLIEDANTVQEPAALGFPVPLVNSKVPNRQASDFSFAQIFCDGLEDLG